MFLQVPPDENCTFQVEVLNMLTRACPGVAPSQLQCRTLHGFHAVVSENYPSSSRCLQDVASINIALARVAFHPVTFSCSLSGAIKNDNNCMRDTEVLRGAVSRYLDGSIQNCEYTTPTTTQTTTQTITPVLEEVILYFPSLNCNFLNDSSQSVHAFHGGIEEAINNECRRVNGHCSLEAFESSCGSVLTEVQVTRVGIPIQFNSVSELLRSRISEGEFNVTFRGVSITNVQVFPLTMTISIQYTGSLQLLAPTESARIILGQTITQLIASNVPIFPEDNVVSEEVSPLGAIFQYTAFLSVPTMAEFRAVRETERLLESHELEGAMEFQFAGISLMLVSPTRTTTLTTSEQDSATRDDDSKLGPLEIVVIIIAILAALLIVVLIVVLRRSTPAKEEPVMIPGAMQDWWNAEPGTGHTKSSEGKIESLHQGPKGGTRRLSSGVENRQYAHEDTAGQIHALGTDEVRWSSDPRAAHSTEWVVWNPTRRSQETGSLLSRPMLYAEYADNPRTAVARNVDVLGVPKSSISLDDAVERVAESTTSPITNSTSKTTDPNELNKLTLFQRARRRSQNHEAETDFDIVTEQLKAVAMQPQDASKESWQGDVDATFESPTIKSSADKIVSDIEVFRRGSEVLDRTDKRLGGRDLLFDVNQARSSRKRTNNEQPLFDDQEVEDQT